MPWILTVFVHSLGRCTIIATTNNCPDSKFHGANMKPIWDRQDPGGPHVGPMNFAICVVLDNEWMVVFIPMKKRDPGSI